MKTKELIDEISDLPVDQRAEIANEILKTLNQPDPKIEKTWAKEARRRLKDYQDGKITSVPGKDVIDSIRNRLSK